MTIIDAQAFPISGRGNPVMVRATITNSTGRDDKLIGGSSPVAEAVGLYMTVGETPGPTDPVTGIAGLAPIPWWPIAANETLQFPPGRGEMVLRGLSEPLVAGQMVEVTFKFAYADPVTVQVPVVSPSPTAAPVPQEVVQRSSLPSCGIENATTQQGPWNTTARRCFWNAYQQGQAAEFISTRLTVEGDPITTIYRVLSAGKIEVFVDTTQDRYSSQGWQRFDCKTLASATTTADGPDFGVDDSCTQTTIH